MNQIINFKNNFQQQFEDIKFNNINLLNLNNFKLFINDRPKNILSGVKNTASNLFRSISYSIIGIIAIPVISTYKDGVIGFFKGISLGILGSLGIIVGGTFISISQIIRGIYFTPEFITEYYFKHKTWDNLKSVWIHYDLEEEKNLLNVSDQEFNNVFCLEFNNPRLIKDNFYYQLLDVDCNASDEEIKRSYHRLCLKYHPDKDIKNNDPEIKNLFNLIKNAYMILSDSQKRKKYDKYGQDYNPDKKNLTTQDLFSLFFGSEKFFNFTGQLNLDLILNAEEQYSKDFVEFKQNKREIEITIYILDLIKTFNLEDPNLFRLQVIKLRDELYKEETSQILLSIIAKSIDSYLNNKITFSLVSLLKSKKKTIKQYWIFLTLIAKSYFIIQKNSEDENDNKKLSSKDIKVLTETIWNLVVFDIEKTLKNVIGRVFNQYDMDNREKQRRQVAMKILGDILGKDCHSKPEKLLQKIEIMMN